MPDDNILVAGGLQDPGNEKHSGAENVSLRMDKTNLLLMFYRIEPAHMSGGYQEIFQSPFALMFMLYLIYFDNKTNFPR